MACFIDNPISWSLGRQVIGITSAFPLLRIVALDQPELELVNFGSVGIVVSKFRLCKTETSRVPVAVVQVLRERVEFGCLRKREAGLSGSQRVVLGAPHPVLLFQISWGCRS